MSGVQRMVRQWQITAVVLLLPLWCLGLFGRGFWTPDEPREAAIAWQMKTQPNQAVPQLAAQPFLEKPPLTYWLSAASMQALGDAAPASRVPNLLYALIAVLSIGALARNIAGARAALTAALIAGSALLAWRVAIWLAPDAALVAGCSLALLGAWRGYVAAAGRAKLLWYGVMHLGALIGFMAKSAPGWIVPGLALFVLIVWERRWRELLRPELYAGWLAQCLIIGSWVSRVWIGPDGEHALRVLFWNNLAGRFTHIDAPPELDYAGGHQNWLGKYWLEMPSYLFPWTLLVIAALVCAWRNLRAPVVSVNVTAWRFAISCCVPFLLLLSVASTARDVYAAPVLGGFALMVALWIDDPRPKSGWLDRFAFSASLWLTLLLPALWLFGLLLSGIPNGYANRLVVIALGAATLLLAWFGARQMRAATQRGDLHDSVVWQYITFAAPLMVAAPLLFGVIDAAQNLPATARAVRAALGTAQLSLLDADETTIAMMNFGQRRHCDLIDSRGVGADAAARSWFAAHGPLDRILLQLPGRGPGPLSAVAGRFAVQRPPGDGVAAELVRANAARLLVRFELPHGRRYGLLGPGSAAGAASDAPASASANDAAIATTSATAIEGSRPQ